MKQLTVTSDAAVASDEQAVLKPARLPPLWLQVAQWCQQSGGPATRLAIAQVFGISLRQASDIMLYISTRRSDVVTARRVVLVSAGGIRTATLEVSAIRDEMMPRRGVATKPRRRRSEAPSAAMRELALGGRWRGGGG
ncbi:CaiF/GrlA family transcriptional regulator [Serratia fonticola]|uniref:CaiF/GrlA family transcriptional regulator n=1 Tax=Serratia fonticola TaxID=47917 RepID=UPI002DB82292|nr:CaiF/GrlA family transcriptional regulator [Serratia fonticola]MEB7884025.1 CaiF/GrlA family transcriptional regulator [Serratia fonticola]